MYLLFPLVQLIRSRVANGVPNLVYVNSHPERTAAAWLMSTLVQASDYEKEGKQELHKGAMAAMGDPAYKEITTQYEQHCGLWSTAAAAVLLGDQVATTLTAAKENTNKNAIAAALDDIPWLQSAASAARSQYLKALAKKRLSASSQQPKPDKENEDRGDTIRKITQAAAESCGQRPPGRRQRLLRSVVSSSGLRPLSS